MCFVQLDEEVHFEVINSRGRTIAPAVKVTFPNGIQKLLDLEAVPSPGKFSMACRYLGKLRDKSQSSAAVTGCLDKPGDKMEITLLSNYSKNSLFSVDFDGNTEVLTNPFDEGPITS